MNNELNPPARIGKWLYLPSSLDSQTLINLDDILMMSGNDEITCIMIKYVGLETFKVPFSVIVGLM